MVIPFNVLYRISDILSYAPGKGGVGLLVVQHLAFAVLHTESAKGYDNRVFSPVQRVLELTGGVGADEVMECSGAADSPMKACRMVRKTGSVAIIATYHDSEVLVPMNMVNFNEIHIVGSKANPSVSEEVLKFFASGAIQGEKLVTHTFPLEEYEKAVDIFEHKKDGSIKVVIHP